MLAQAVFFLQKNILLCAIHMGFELKIHPAALVGLFIVHTHVLWFSFCFFFKLPSDAESRELPWKKRERELKAAMTRDITKVNFLFRSHLTTKARARYQEFTFLIV